MLRNALCGPGGGPAQANLFVIEPSRKERLEREQSKLPPKTMPRVLVIALGPANGSVTGKDDEESAASCMPSNAIFDRKLSALFCCCGSGVAWAGRIRQC
jgi:hypothetical protein